MAVSTYLKTQMVKWAFTADSVTRPTTWYVSMHLSDPGLAGADEVDPAAVTGDDTAYTRIAVTPDYVATPGQVKNAGTVTFPTAAAVAASYTVTHFGVWDAATAGNFLGGEELALPKVVEDGTVLSFGVGDLIIEVN